MPWKESSVMDERLRFVARLLDGEQMSHVCREFGNIPQDRLQDLRALQGPWHRGLDRLFASAGALWQPAAVPGRGDNGAPSDAQEGSHPAARHEQPAAAGRLCLHRKKINLSTVLAGQTVGIKEVDDGVWLASFMHYDLGYIDLEQRTLQPLDNPFGPRLSPMS
jgi:hypothetical protein